MNWFRIAAGALMLPLAWMGPGRAEDLFLDRVSHLLEDHCFRCHNSVDRKGEFSLQTKDELAASGFVEPGDPESSVLIEALESRDGRRPSMPQTGRPLSASELRDLKRWIREGARWPDGHTLGEPRPIDRNWWSLLELKRPPPPATPSNGPLNLAPNWAANWARNPVDAFLAARLAEQRLAPSPEAGRATLIRRLYFDLIGLPPTVEQVSAFVANPDPLAYEKLVDQLLASPRYGERWARHWMDIVHYADTHGYDKDKPRLNAWPYRDYLIRAWNRDKPYRRFVQEQLAGDVLFHDADGMEATGFVAAGPWDYAGHAEVPETKRDGLVARHLDRDDMVATTMNTFCSATVQCARCHNHKLDPVSMTDYYRLQAVFAGVDRADRKYDADPAVARTRQLLKAQLAEVEGAAAALAEELEALKTPEFRDLEKRLAALASEEQGRLAPRYAEQRAAWRRRRDELQVALFDPDQVARLQSLRDKADSLGGELEALPPESEVYSGVVHFGDGDFRGRGGLGPREIFVLQRGDVSKPGAAAQPGAIPLWEGDDGLFQLSDVNDEGQRRSALAQWITRGDHPLTWRSIANRIWQYHFGRGLAASPNDFGRGGEPPTHPELLDYLACEIRDHQSIKRLHRLICLSAAYRQSSMTPPAEEGRGPQAIDSDNRLLWRMNRRRLTAEEIRDAVLVAAGNLNLRMGGPGFQDFVLEQPDNSPHYEYYKHNPNDSATHRRAVYRFIVRSQPQPFMAALDCADPSVLVPQRNETLTAVQALTMLNNPFIVAMSEQLAASVEREQPAIDLQLRRAFERTIGRPPEPDELAVLEPYRRRRGLAAACRALLNLNEFLFVD